MKKNTVGWSQAPHEILELIVDRINSIEDYVRFGVVCKSWRLVTLDRSRLTFSPKTLPWLMFPLLKKDEFGKNTCIDNPNFFSLSEDKYYKLDLPEARNCRLIGSPYGWLILYKDERLEIYNPLTRLCIPLPKYDKHIHPTYQFAHLVMMSSTTSLEAQYMVVVNYVQGLAFIRAGDLAWTTIKIANTTNSDMLYLNNVLYIVGADGIVSRFDVTNPNPVAKKFVQPPAGLEMNCLTVFHLVELLGELHLVVKYASARKMSADHHFVVGSRAFKDKCVYYFRVFKLDFTTKKWKELITLGDYTFFVGENVSFSVRASDYSHCKRGCIYFSETTGNLRGCGGDIGIFDVETHGMEVLFTGRDVFNLHALPVWFIPSLC